MILNQEEATAPAGPPTRRDARPSWLRILIASAIGVAMMYAMIFVRVPLLTVYPGPAPDISSLIDIKAPNVKAPSGSFHITTVILYEATTIEAIKGWVSPRIAVIPREAVYPAGVSEEEVDRETAADMTESQYTATIAALSELGYDLPPDGLIVRTTFKGVPSAQVLVPGDVIVGADGRGVAIVEDLRSALSGHRPGDVVPIRVRRGTEMKEVEVRTIESSDPPVRPVLGIVFDQNFRLPFEVSIAAGDIGGPSAGLMFALSIFDLLDPQDLTKGRVIAGTGEITAKGEVKRVGGVAQKVLGSRCIPSEEGKSGKKNKCRKAAVFFVPKDEEELKEAREAAGLGIRVIGVSSLKEAVEALRSM